MSMKEDLAKRSPDIHWPEGFSPADADLFVHNEIFINAPCERVWDHIIEATKWPDWYPNSQDVRIEGGILEENRTFTWKTFGLPLESLINEFAPYSRIGWFGQAPGTAPSWYHTWHLSPASNGCLVVTEEVGKGPIAVQLRETDEDAMHKSHDVWLTTLKQRSEG